MEMLSVFGDALALASNRCSWKYLTLDYRLLSQHMGLPAELDRGDI
jgi:hypothetical protein